MGQIRDLEHEWSRETAQRIATENTTLKQRVRQLATENRTLAERLEALQLASGPAGEMPGKPARSCRLRRTSCPSRHPRHGDILIAPCR